ncbi:MAG: PAS domain S-box protein, partial [Verrucomicrobiales bacterium]|nr:PAS domain S-box protein [Verrucomicrobiales bacterium]
EAFARERGYSKEELVGRKLVEVYPPELHEELSRRLAAVDEVGHVVFDGIHVRKDGSRFPVLVEVTSIRDAAGKPVSRVAYAVDISDRKRAEELLRQRNEELMRFIYTVSHDLKSPLVTIRTFLGYLERDMQSRDAARVETDLGYIRKAAEKMSDLLDEILELSRVGRKVNPPEDVPLQAVVGDALDLVAGPLASGKIEVRVTDEPLVLTGDRRRLLELFQNLIDNAVKFMGDQPAPRVEIGAEKLGDAWVLFVRDNGIGIDPRHQDRLFGLFEKLHPGFPGNGVGLAIVKRIVEVHGGRIWVESQGPGCGTTFRFTLARLGKPTTPPEASPC